MIKFDSWNSFSSNSWNLSWNFRHGINKCRAIVCVDLYMKMAKCGKQGFIGLNGFRQKYIAQHLVKPASITK